MRVGVIEVPYNLGERNVGVGTGPSHLASLGLRDALRESADDVYYEQVRVERVSGGALPAVARINRAVAEIVTSMRGNHRLPLVVAGNCNTSLGAIAASDPDELGVIWFDAHGDFNTPETSSSGFLDGMALAIATGRCYPDTWKEMGAKANLRDAHIVLAGVRDLDAGEKRQIEDSKVSVCDVDAFDLPEQAAFVSRLDAIRKNVKRVFVHVDVDAMDPSVAPGVEYKTANGLSLAAIETALKHICDRFFLEGLAVADYSPDHDDDNKTARACISVLRAGLKHANKENR